MLLRNAINRITDLANNLLAKYQEVIHVYSVTDQAELIADLVSLVVSEKRVQYEDLNIDLYLDIAPGAYCAFVLINAGAFKQSMANLIDNAVEAITRDVGKVIIRLSLLDNKSVGLTIEDNGCGIPYELMKKVLRGGVTTKEGGYGMGLSKARKMLEERKGTLSIESQVDVGTKIIMTLPRAEAAEWFIGKITVTQDCKIIVLDDDLSSHHMWTDFFQSRTTPSDNIQLSHFYNVQSFIDFYSTHENDGLFFLIDYDLLHDDIDGLDLVEQFNIASSTILVTNKYDCTEVRTRAKALAIKILPKIYVPHVQVEIICKNNNQEYTLLDDDHLVCDLWQLAAERAGKSIATFQDPDEFKKYVLKCGKDMAIYIDSKLPAFVKGEMIAKELYELGYSNIYLASGYPASKFAHVTWVRGVVGKEPPF